MRIDVVTIFPDYLAPLGLSLPGKAQQAGLLDVRVHDLRRWAHDRHRTVDDTPYGGGAGMVMKPEPWGEALDDLAADGPAPVVVVPSPSGEPLTQALAAELAAEPRLLFACGRYEGIDQRVIDHARTRWQVREVSIGDYVLNGGEVAALVVTEAVVRLLPGFMGNPESLAEESHGSGGLLEYPVYTKPADWRDLDVPPVLLGGDHAAIAAWRHEQALRRTAQRRPDLLHPAAVLDELEVRTVQPSDAGELLTLQRACWVQEMHANPDVLIDALTESLDDVRALDRRGHRAGRTLRRPPRRCRPGPRARGRRQHRVGHRTTDGRPRPPGPRDRPDAAHPHRGAGAAGGGHLRAVHRRGQPPQPGDLQEVGYRSRGEVRPGVVGMSKRVRRR